MRISELYSLAKEEERLSLIDTIQTHSEKYLHDNTSIDSSLAFQIAAILEAKRDSQTKLLLVFSLLRKFYLSEFYKKHKTDEGITDIGCAHTLALAPLLETNPWKSFFGLIQPNLSGSLSEKIQKKRAHLLENGAHQKGHSWKYMLLNPDVLLHAFRSHPIGHALLGWIWPYDPRLAENYPSLLLREEEKLYHAITPTPTIGVNPSLEALAIIQAIENRQKGRAKGRAVDYKKNVKGWVYINLQSLHKEIERRRSLSLMSLNSSFPEQFFGITLDVNSSFYRYYQEESFSNSFKERIHQWLFDPLNYTLSSQGHYFPIAEKERPEWEERLRILSEEAFYLINTGTELEKQSAYKELMLLMIVRAWQGKIFRALSSRSDQIELLSTIACKECIDRGGKLNASLLWALDPSIDEEVEKKVIALFYGRALLARKRMIQPHRSDSFMDLVNVVPRMQVRDFCNRAFA